MLYIPERKKRKEKRAMIWPSKPLLATLCLPVKVGRETVQNATIYDVLYKVELTRESLVTT